MGIAVMELKISALQRSESSRQEELPLLPLTEPYVKLSLHTALIIQPKA
jgi:hypothetical protein